MSDILVRAAAAAALKAKQDAEAARGDAIDAASTAAADAVDALMPAAADAIRGEVSDDADRAEAAADALDGMVDALTPQTGYMFLVADAGSNMLLGVREDGTLDGALTQDIDGKLSGLREDVTDLQESPGTRVPSKTGLLFGILDGDGNDLLYVDEAGDLHTAAGDNVSAFFRGGGVSETTQALLYPTADIYMPGDSLTENAMGWPELAALFTGAGQSRTLTLQGFGGQGATSILARQGGRPTLVTFPANADGIPEIPASGAANVTVTASPLSYADITQAKSMTGTIQIGAAGVSGTLARTANTNDYTFTRTVAGDAIEVDPAVPLIPNNASLIARTQICFIGTNNMATGAASDILGYIDAFAARQPTLLKRTVVLMPLWDMDAGTSATAKATYEALLPLVKAKYPHCYVDTRAVLQRANSGSSDDLTDISNGLVPRSIYSASGWGDGTHFLPTGSGGLGYTALAQAVFDVLQRNGW